MDRNAVINAAYQIYATVGQFDAAQKAMFYNIIEMAYDGMAKENGGNPPTADDIVDELQGIIHAIITK